MRNKKAELLEMLKNTLIMLAITLVAGGILGIVYEQTKGPIATMELQAKKEANKKVFTIADSFSEDILDAEAMKNALENKGISGVDITEVLEAKNASGEVIGYVLEVNSHEGYGGDIVFRIGIASDGSTNGISITQISETAGLGMRAEEVLVPQFENRVSSEFVVTKN